MLKSCIPYNHSNTKIAKILRQNMTPEERKLWYCFLKTYRPRFTRQKPIGEYIVDFFCKEKGIAIEIDGSQHFQEQAIEEDRKRTEALNRYGIGVIRFSNREVNQRFEAVCTAIDQYVSERPIWTLIV